MEEDIKQYLLEKYQDVNFPGAYTGVDKFYKAIRKEKKQSITKKQIKEFLQSQEYYTLMRQVNRKCKRNRVITPYKGYQVDLDTVHLHQYAKLNSGYSYILAGIDCFSKEAHTVALKSLKSQEFIPALKSLLSKFSKIHNCRTDSGPEFKAQATRTLFKNLGINHFFTNNTETKANIVERFFKTLKNILFRYMVSKNTHKWIDQLEKITNSYNNTYHSSIKQSPASVKPSDEYKIWKLLYETERPDEIKTKFKFNIHDTVRISVLKHQFMREFDEKWSREYFIIADRFMKDVQPVYILKDIQNEALTGRFQENELQKILVSDDDTYIIEKILKKSKGRVLIKWLGWPSKHATWIKESDIQNWQKTNM